MIVVYNRAFVALWMRGKGVAYGGGLLVLAASAAALLQGLFSLWGWCFRRERACSPGSPWAQLASAVVNLVASVALTTSPRIGLAGPMLGTLVAFLSVNVWFFRDTAPAHLRHAGGLGAGGRPAGRAPA